MEGKTCPHWAFLPKREREEKTTKGSKDHQVDFREYMHIERDQKDHLTPLPSKKQRQKKKLGPISCCQRHFPQGAKLWL